LDFFFKEDFVALKKKNKQTLKSAGQTVFFFTTKETEAQKEEVTCLRSHSK
jgi:hypothetical protein